MKKISKPIAMILIVLCLTFTSFTGCSSTPTEAFYSFSENDSPSAIIEFDSGNPGVSFIDFEGVKLPKPDKRTYWSNKITFPAEEPLQLTVHASYTPPTPMTDIGVALGEIAGKIMPAGDVGIAGFFVFLIGVPFFAASLGFFALALFVDVPMAIALTVNKNVVFDCLPLETDRIYALGLRRRNKGKGITRALVLTDAGTDMVVYEQEF